MKVIYSMYERQEPGKWSGYLVLLDNKCPFFSSLSNKFSSVFRILNWTFSPTYIPNFGLLASHPTSFKLVKPIRNEKKTKLLLPQIIFKWFGQIFHFKCLNKSRLDTFFEANEKSTRKKAYIFKEVSMK